MEIVLLQISEKGYLKHAKTFIFLFLMQSWALSFISSGTSKMKNKHVHWCFGKLQSELVMGPGQCGSVGGLKKNKTGNE